VLSGFALEAALQHRLLERYDDDFFRNPAAGAYIGALLRRMVLEEPAELGKELGAGDSALVSAGDRLVSVMAR
jgi:hypothetical protein